MFNFFSALQCLFFSVVLIAIPIFVSAGQATAPHYTLALSFEPENSALFATAKVDIPANTEFSLDLTHLNPTGALLRDESGGEKQIVPTESVISLPASPVLKTLFISYTKIIHNDRDNLVSKDGIALLDSWYPYPSEPCIFSISAEIPDGFKAITVSDRFPLSKAGNVVTAHRSEPTRDMFFVAGPYEIQKQKVRDSLFVYSMFFEEDKDLATKYLEAAVRYIQQFEEKIGPFPYNHYVIVANRFPTGYGMPTFTLLGQMVLRLPFIVNTSLGHEIVHSWFGNSVRVDYSEGNWCEGLTSFLTDHGFREAEGTGAEDRKESLLKYHSYVSGNAAEEKFSLAQFKSASHSQPMAEFKRTVGYEGGAFLFHELREYLGRKIFQKGIRKFYSDFRESSASWTDIRRTFEAVSHKNLESFFQTRLNMTKPPLISAENISLETDYPIRLKFTLKQQTEEAIPLTIPIAVKTMAGTTRTVLHLDTFSADKSIQLDGIPLEFTLDPEYDLLRQLTPEEQVPVWSRFLGAEHKLIILESEATRGRYQPFLDSLARYAPTIVTADTVTNKALGENSLLFLGADQAPCRSLFGSLNYDKNKVIVDVRNNPLNREHVAVIISAPDEETVPSIARRLSHYGKYSYLEFSHGRATVQKITKSENGIRYLLETLPDGIPTTAVSSFSKLMDEIADNRVIYIGETHDSLADHRLQLRVIEALYRKNPNLAIGMEMFPASSQKSLDAYTRGDSTMDEKTFLKESKYFDVWQFDYRYYRDILRFARSKHIPVLGLNLDRKIVSEVYRSGTTDGLEKAVKDKLVTDRNLDMPGYQERLMAMHGAHVSGNHGAGFASGFIQAQALWDETMADGGARFLLKNPDHQLVILAGSQHTRKDSGIPPRLARRISVSQAVLINIAGEAVPENLSDIADYVFMENPISLPESPKIGIVLTSGKTPSGEPDLVIDEISPHGKAGQAGLAAGDFLVNVDGHKITDMTDIRIALMDHKAGDIVKIEVRRKGGKPELQTFRVELTVPGQNMPMPPGHP